MYTAPGHLKFVVDWYQRGSKLDLYLQNRFLLIQCYLSIWSWLYNNNISSGVALGCLYLIPFVPRSESGPHFTDARSANSSPFRVLQTSGNSFFTQNSLSWNKADLYRNIDPKSGLGEMVRKD